MADERRHQQEQLLVCLRRRRKGGLNKHVNFCHWWRFLTVSHCIFTSSHYRCRCQWERNQSLNVCLSQSSRSEWVLSLGWLCSNHSPHPQPRPAASAQLLVNCIASVAPVTQQSLLYSLLCERHDADSRRLVSWVECAAGGCCQWAAVEQGRSEFLCVAPLAVTSLRTVTTHASL